MLPRFADFLFTILTYFICHGFSIRDYWMHLKKSFVKHGYGPTNFCHRTVTTKKLDAISLFLFWQKIKKWVLHFWSACMCVCLSVCMCLSLWKVPYYWTWEKRSEGFNSINTSYVDSFIIPNLRNISGLMYIVYLAS